MESFEIIRVDLEGFPCLKIKGYFNKETGTAILPIVDELLGSGKVKILIDFSECTVLNSPGVSAVLAITMKIVEDFQGKLVLFGLNELKLSVLDFTGVTELAQTAKNPADAIQLVKS